MGNERAAHVCPKQRALETGCSIHQLSMTPVELLVAAYTNSEARKGTSSVVLAAGTIAPVELLVAPARV